MCKYLFMEKMYINFMSLSIFSSMKGHWITEEDFLFQKGLNESERERSLSA